MQRHIIKKENCNFFIEDHKRLNSSINVIKEVFFKYKRDGIEQKIYFTNAGWLADNDRTWFCPASFYNFEALQLIENVSEEFSFRAY